jgi:hypothetical protein
MYQRSARGDRQHCTRVASQLTVSYALENENVVSCTNQPIFVMTRNVLSAIPVPQYNPMVLETGACRATARLVDDIYNELLLK